MLEEEYSFPTYLGDIIRIRIGRDDRASLTHEQRVRARVAARELRLGAASNVGPVVQAVIELQRALGGGSPGFSPTLDGQASLEGLVAALEVALETGRLVVVEGGIPLLGVPPEFELTGREERPSGPPPLPPIARGTPPDALTFFEVRFVDEIGQAISGLDVELKAGSEVETATTNGAGVATLEDVPSMSGSVSVVDIDALGDIVEPRWEKVRTGVAPTGINTKALAFTGEDILGVSLKPAVPNTVVITPPTAKLFLELWDKTGRVKHIGKSYHIDGPASFDGTTDENGRILHEAVPLGDYELTLTLEFFEGANKQTDVYKARLVALNGGDEEPQLRQIGVVPRVVMGRVRGMLFDTNKDFILPTAIKSLRQIRRIYEENSPSKLLIVGHTDTTAEPDINDPLSLDRAKSVKAYLEDDVDTWLGRYDEGVPKQKRWGPREDRLMIVMMPGFDTKPEGQSLIEWYQEQHNKRAPITGRPVLDVDGEAGPKTRTELISDYMGLDGASLGEASDFEIDVTTHGCGENFPLDQTGLELDKAPEDDSEDQLDRRAELFFFDTDFGILPKPAGPAGQEYLEWRKAAIENSDFVVDGIDTRVEFIECEDVLFATDSAVPLPSPSHAPANVGPKEPSALNSVAAALRFAFCSINKKTLVAGHTDTTADPSVNDPLSEKRAITVLALLVGERDEFRLTCDEQHVDSDIDHILKWADACFEFGSDPAKVGQLAAIKAFQQGYNDLDQGGNEDAEPLDLDGDFGPLTWGAVFDLYELRLSELLRGDRELLAAYRKELKFVDLGKRAIGYGENFPTEEKGRDNFRSQENRRVEILFFDPGEEPDLALPPDVSDIYLPGIYRHEPLPVDGDAIPENVVAALRLPTRFSDSRTFPKPSCLPALSALAQRVEEFPHTRLVIIGHTDHTQRNAENEQLSLARAEAVRALLTQDRQFFIDRFDNPDPVNEWNWEEVQWMLSAVKVEGDRCYVGHADDRPSRLTREALGLFQLGSDDLEVDFGCDVETLRQLVDAYFALLEAPPLLAEQIEVVAGGSWHPERVFGTTDLAVDPEAEVAASNRRVEVFLFEQPVLPEAENVDPGTRVESKEYRTWVRRATELEAPPVTFPIRLFDANLVPLKNAGFSLTKIEPEELGASTSLSANASGTAEFSGEPGSYQLQVSAQGREHFFAVLVQVDDVGGFAGVLPHALDPVPPPAT